MESDLFPSLSTELVCMILSHLSSPQDLYSVLRASPYLYRGAITGSKTIIVRNVAENAFNSIALPEALVMVRFLHSDDFSDKKCHHPQRLASMVLLTREAARQPSPTLSESVELCRHFPSFNFFHSRLH
jgi:hypothetical protein